MQRINTALFLMIAYFTYLQGCQSEKKIPPKIQTMTFAVNPALLGDSLYLKEIGLSLRVPRNWVKLPDSLQKIVESRLQLVTVEGVADSLQKLHLLSIHSSGNNEASMVLSRVEFSKQDSTDTLRVQRYKKNIKEQSASAEIGIADFIANGIPMTQFLIRTPQTTTFKLLYKTKHTFVQCDYIISTNIFKQEIRAVESSIGSMQLY